MGSFYSPEVGYIWQIGQLIVSFAEETHDFRKDRYQKKIKYRGVNWLSLMIQVVELLLPNTQTNCSKIRSTITNFIHLYVHINHR